MAGRGDPDDEPRTDVVEILRDLEAQRAQKPKPVLTREELERQRREAWERSPVRRLAEPPRLSPRVPKIEPLTVEPLVAERREPLRVEVVTPPETKPRGRKSRWNRVQLESVMKRLANGEGLHEIERQTGVRHQRISELRRRGDVRWDSERRQLVTPPGTISHRGEYILPPPP